MAADADASVRRVVDVVRDFPAGDSDARARGEPEFQGTGRQIETWLGVITEQRREGGYVIDFKVGQSFGEPHRYVGFTGHKDPSVHLRMLELAEKHRFEFDMVQKPLNVMDAHFRSFGKEVLPVLVKKNIGVSGMKSMASRHILESKTVSPVECLHYALSLPTSVVITGIDSMAVLDQAFEAARTFSSVSKSDVSGILEKPKPAAADGRFEPFKTSVIFDSTAAHPEWLGYNPQT